jgi:hypothetical protein
MAQTKRKRRSKHRGNAAGVIETRGRTGRPMTAEERKKQTRIDARQKRATTPPSWRSSLTRASFAAVILFIFLLAASKNHSVPQALIFALFAMVVYVPTGYYLEVALYRRRMRKRAAGSPK